MEVKSCMVECLNWSEGDLDKSYTILNSVSTESRRSKDAPSNLRVW